ncbi:MAG: hypothetical protein WBP03_05395 [Candidatus Saccharimonadales bacterium]
MTSTERAYELLAEELSALGVQKSVMFGMPTLKLGRKAVCGLRDDGVVFRLPVQSEEMQQALSLKGSHLFQPEMHGRKGPLMKQWVVVPPKHGDHYADFAMCSIRFVESGV